METAIGRLPQAHQRRAVARLLLHLALQAHQLRQEMLGETAQALPLGRQGHALLAPARQGHAQPPLRLPQPVRDGGLGDPQAIGGSSHAARLL